MKKVLFVGISDKDGMEPFDEKTNSGWIIHSISEQLNCVSYFLNYVSLLDINYFE